VSNYLKGAFGIGSPAQARSKGGSGSHVTSMSDLDKFDKIPNAASNANKQIIRVSHVVKLISISMASWKISEGLITIGRLKCTLKSTCKASLINSVNAFKSTQHPIK
jgi:hypothetical protein